MKKFVVFAAVVGIFAYYWPTITMNFASYAQYTEQDTREYAFYTPELLKKMPRISDHYQFDYTNVSGPQALIYTVTFYDADDTRQISDYLTAAGYQRQPECLVAGECWMSANAHYRVSVVKPEGFREVSVQLEDSSQ
ncbi:Uncharacterised protein [Serratia rubidaea]|uniref:hypothetical protein n=1 Tax=Serratia rubidaea TaxID=61652 RepID=UPI0006C75404|nr:hypothetical protein [Serratia rubidaea]QPR64301.1 hypothetical protein I6G83_03300 [Serratia rubidaea]CAI1070471.1 Uncharacterised protein [Serratia rubidaea]CAI1883689.1 Uncharacterised protein [Serratia rubidaea]HAY0638376.1 hypothetical protein [Serratia rubidaea]HDJ1439285.1 hypothetical protein [Serratia rubidaea]